MSVCAVYVVCGRLLRCGHGRSVMDATGGSTALQTEHNMWISSVLVCLSCAGVCSYSTMLYCKPTGTNAGGWRMEDRVISQFEYF